MRELGVVGEENVEQELVVEEVDYSAGLPDRVHRQLRGSNVDDLDAGLGCDHRTNRRSAQAILFDHEVLQGHRRRCICSEDSQDRSTHRVSHVPLVRIDLDHHSIVDFRMVLSLVLLWVVRMDGVGHVCRNHKTISNDSEVVFFGEVTLEIEGDSLSGFANEVAVGTLGRLGTNLFVVEKHDHANFSVVLRTSLVEFHK